MLKIFAIVTLSLVLSLITYQTSITKVYSLLPVQTTLPDCTPTGEGEKEKCCINYEWFGKTFRVCWTCADAEEAMIDVTKCDAAPPTIDILRATVGANPDNRAGNVNEQGTTEENNNNKDYNSEADTLNPDSDGKPVLGKNSWMLGDRGNLTDENSSNDNTNSSDIAKKGSNKANQGISQSQKNDLNPE
jgi:hypothetical protein